MEAVAVVSPLCILSTLASALPTLPQSAEVLPAVKVAEATPFDWMVACWLDKVPCAAFVQLTAWSIRVETWPVVSGTPLEFCRKLAFKVVESA